MVVVDFFRDEAFMSRFHVILHFIRPGELLATYWTREHFTMFSFVVEEGVPLEAVLIFESLLDIFFRTFGALVYSFRYACIAEKIQASNGHFRKMLGLIIQ